jgi:SNF2 family DNA or RNA helicase
MERQVTLTPEQRVAYESMRKQMIMDTDEHSITAVNAADKINKLRQILCGVIKEPHTGEYRVLAHSPRVDVLKECIEQANAKVLVIVPFKGIVRSLEAELRKMTTVAVVNGDVSVKERNRIFGAFKLDEDPKVLLCHPKVMAHGLNLTEADTLIFYAPIYSNDEYQQVQERFNRAGQTRPMTIVRMAGHPLEWDIYRVAESRTATQDAILDLYRKNVLSKA